MNKQRPILLLVILALVVAVPFSNAQAQQFSEEELSRFLKQHPGADADGDGKLTAEEIKAARTYKKQAAAAAAQRKGGIHPGWEKDEFPPHAVSLKTPDEIMAIYKRGPAGRSYVDAGDALSF